jgi:hypothetical protein
MARDRAAYEGEGWYTMDREMDTPIVLRIGAACAIVGAVVSVAAGTGFGNRTTTWETARLLSYLAARPAWYWPLVHLGFITGAVLWVIAFRIIADTLPDGLSRSLGRLATVTIIFGAAIHIIDSSIDGVGLSAIARSWAAAPAADQPVILRTAAAVVDMVEGVWASVIALFHGLPFALIGAAALISRRYPAWLGWVGIAGGIGSLVLGVLMFLGTQVMLYIAGAIVVSVWMVAMGFLLWQRAEDAAARS